MIAPSGSRQNPVNTQAGADGDRVILRLSEVSKGYPLAGGQSRPALDRVSLEVDRGEVVGVFGPVGAGKTTLLRIAAGLLATDAGSVHYKGQRLDQMSPGERMRFRRQELACVWSSQEWQARLTVLDHVALPLLVDRRDRRFAQQRASEALLVCEAEQCAEMELGELSDGERQRVALARALVSEPKLLLADAPGRSLPLLERESVMLLLASLAREAKVAVLVTSSDADSLVQADPALYLCNGKLVTPDPEVENAQVYRFPALPGRRAAADA